MVDTITSIKNDVGPGDIQLLGYRTLSENYWQAMETDMESKKIRFKEELWNAICSGNYKKARIHLDTTRFITCPTFGVGALEAGKKCHRHCLQVLVYMSWLEEKHEHKFFLQEQEQEGEHFQDSSVSVDLRTQEGKTSMFWAVKRMGKHFKKNFSMKDGLIILRKYHEISRMLIYEILKDDSQDILLMDGTPLLHILLLVGHKYERDNQSINLLQMFLAQHREEVDVICPWSQLSALDIALRMNLTMHTTKMLYEVGARANVFIMDEFNIFKEDSLHARINSIQGTTAVQKWQGCRNFIKSLKQLKNEERIFIKEVKDNVIPKWVPDKSEMKEAKITEVIYSWINRDLLEHSEKMNLSFRIDLAISGSINEGCKIKPLDEIDLVVECSIENYVSGTDKSLYSDWLFSTKNTLDIQKELAKVGAKNPLRHLCEVHLKQGHPEFGMAGDMLDPNVFSTFMNDFVKDAIQEENMPVEVEKREDKPLLELTRSGLFMHLTWIDEMNEQQKLTLDIVSVLKFSQATFGKVLSMMPRYHEEKYQYLCHHQLWSSRDGAIVKDGAWRLSFSNSEAKLMATNLLLFQTLKYLNKRSENHIDIETYYLKETLCSFLVHQGMQGERGGRLSSDLAKLITFSSSNPISSPFYCTKLGSRLELNVRNMFTKIEEYLPHQIFRHIQMRTISEGTNMLPSYFRDVNNSKKRHRSFGDKPDLRLPMFYLNLHPSLKTLESC